MCTLTNIYLHEMRTKYTGILLNLLRFCAQFDVLKTTKRSFCARRCVTQLTVAYVVCVHIDMAIM